MNAGKTQKQAREMAQIKFALSSFNQLSYIVDLTHDPKLEFIAE